MRADDPCGVHSAAFSVPRQESVETHCLRAWASSSATAVRCGWTLFVGRAGGVIKHAMTGASHARQIPLARAADTVCTAMMKQWTSQERFHALTLPRVDKIRG